MNTKSEYHTATDYLDDVRRNNRFFDLDQLDSLFAMIASLGIKRHEWVIASRTRLYESNPAGYDLLSEAVQAAHRHGIAFHAVFKPFERIPHYVPHVIPQPHPHVWSDLYGSLLPMPAFEVENPHFFMQRAPLDSNLSGPVTEIRLVKPNTEPTKIRPEHLEIWISDRLGTWKRYTGSFKLEDRVEYRSSFTHRGDSRIVILSGLDIPETERYIEVRFSSDWTDEEFIHHPHAIIELAGSDGALLPSSPAHIGSAPERFKAFTTVPLLSRINPCMNDPEFANFVQKADLDAIWSEYREVGWPWQSEARIHAHEDRCITAARGVLPRIPILHPGYPEVRSYWLAQIRDLLDKGVDGVNIRPSSHYHFRTTPPEAYGFNEPSLQSVDEPQNRADIAEANGSFFTGFLREARRLIAGEYGKELGVHVLAPFFYDRDESGKQLDFALMDWQWREWVRDIADYAEFRGLMGFRPLTGRLMVEEVAKECRKHSTPLILQSDRRLVAGGLMKDLKDEAQWAFSHPDITAYQLYETANFSAIDEKTGKVVCNPPFKAFVEN